MKTKITIFAIISHIIFSCNYADNIEIEPYLKDSITFSINTKTNTTQPVSRIASKAIVVNETLYEDLNIYIFDEKDNLFDYIYTTNTSDLNNIELTIWKGAKYSIYGIANVGKKIYAETINELTEKSHSISSIEQISSVNGGVLMTGHTPPTILTDEIILDLTLTRSVAKISFQIDQEDLSSGTSIEITKVSIKNIPNKVNLFKESRATSINDIIIEGDSRTGNELSEIANSGCSFYIYENMQGSNLLPTNETQPGKTFSSSDPRRKLCSYLEIESKYNSPIKTGTIKHRFYLGEDDLTNFNIIRNKHYTHTLSFNESGINEASWRVDISDLKEYVTNISLSPPEHRFRRLQETKQISASILPHTAHDKSLIWSTSNPLVATVDQSGIVTSISNGNCRITATTSDGSNKTASSIIEVLKSQITISGQEIMFQGEASKATVRSISPSNAPIVWSSSNRSILTIDQLGNVQAVGTGNATVRGETIGEVYSEYRISVVPLTLSLTSAPNTFYKGFKEIITYSITPTHAQTLHNEDKLHITWTSINKNIDNDRHIYWGKKAGNDQIIAYFTDFSNIKASTNTTTLNALSINTTYHSTDAGIPYIRILNNAELSKKKNMKYREISINHQISSIKHPNANVSWRSSDSDISINSSNQIYCTGGSFFATNGKHSLTGSIIDDFNITHTVTIPLRIYEEVNITCTYGEDIPLRTNPRKVNTWFSFYIEPNYNKDAGNISFYFDNAFSWRIIKNSGWIRQSGRSMDHESYPRMRHGEFNVYYPEGVRIEDTTSPDGLYRYYISLFSK